MKIELELHLPGDGRIFINRWDYKHGNDSTAELRDGKLIMYDVDGEFEVSLSDFINEVIENS